MKKDIYPDIRIEVISEGLTKKILESSESPAPAVYGEEQPEGKNLPNVGIKGKNKELQSVLETSNKKPVYTGLVKEAIQELRKDNQNKYAVGSDKRELTAPDAMTGPNFGASRKREDTPVIRGGTGLGGRETDAPLTEDRVDIDLRRQGTAIPAQASTSAEGLSSDAVDRGDRALSTEGFSRGTTREGTTIQGGKVGDIQPALTEAGFGRGASQEAKQNIPMQTVADKSKKESARMRGAASIGSGRLEEAMVKEAIQELRKSKKKVSELSKDNGPMVGALPPLTTTDVISNVNQAVNSGRSLDAGTVKEITDNPQKYQTQLTSLFDKGTQEQKLQVGFGALASGLPKVADSGYTPPAPTAGSSVASSAGLPTLDQTLDTKVPTASEAGPAPASTPGPGGLGIARPEGGPSDTVVLDPETQGASAPDRTNRGKGPSGPTGDSGMPGYTPIGEENLLIEEPPDPFENVDTSVLAELDKKNKEGFSSTSLSPEILRPKGSGGQDLPEFGSSGYFSAVLQIGEGGTTKKDGEDVPLSEVNYGVKDLPEFLSLYAQNPQFDQRKFLDNIGEVNKADLEKADIKNPFRAALKKQAPMVGGAAGQLPKTTSMTSPPNMGVNAQQPVVTGAGTMKNTEKAVAANKPAAAPAKTKARRTAAGSIEQRKEKAYIARQAQKALIKSGMVWDQINKQWVPMSKG